MEARRRDRGGVAARQACVPELFRGHLGAPGRGRPAPPGRPIVASALKPLTWDWDGEDVCLDDVDVALALLRADAAADGPSMRTSVMTHIAWVPERWVGQARAALEGMDE